jgi:hypothetical protein
MALKPALVGQFKAGLAMLRECIVLCPEDLWGTAIGKPPRTFWRIAYHNAFYTHLYLSPNYSEFKAWEKHVDHAIMTVADEGQQLPPEDTVYSPSDLLGYIDLLSEQMAAMIERLDLESPESGFGWYPNFSKLDHVLLTLRHLGVHVGQLQELLFARGIEPNWISKVRSAS